MEGARVNGEEEDEKKSVYKKRNMDREICNQG
jgi:hypothetical protein